MEGQTNEVALDERIKGRSKDVDVLMVLETVWGGGRRKRNKEVVGRTMHFGGSSSLDKRANRAKHNA